MIILYSEVVYPLLKKNKIKIKIKIND